MGDKATLKEQIKIKQQEAEAWGRAFSEGKDVAARSKASQNYMLALEDLKVLKSMAKAFDVNVATDREVNRSVTQMVEADEPTLLNEQDSFDDNKDVDHETRMVADFEYFCRHLEITYRPGLNPDHPEGGFGPFILAEGQKKLAALMIQKMLVERQSLRLVILKSRQLGCTTFLLAFWIWLLTRIDHFHVFFMIDVGKHAETKRNMILKWVESLNRRWPHLFSEVKRGGKKAHMLIFENESILFIDSAESTNPGTSEMLHVLHTSEKPKWIRGRARLIKESVEPALPSSPMTANVDESTACGLEDFYFKWRLATTDPDSGIIPVFLPWYITSETSLPVTKDFQWSERVEFQDVDPSTDKIISEVEYAAMHGLTKGQVMWRRWAILTKFEGNRQSFDQEHPTTPGHAFRQFSNHFFQKKTRIKSSRPSNFLRGTLYDMNGNNHPEKMVNWADVDVVFKANNKGNLFVRETPIIGNRYYIGVDVAEGKTIIDEKGKNDPDYTVMTVKNSQGKTVATWLGRMPPEEAWLPLLLLAVYFNRAIVNGEKNGPGHTLLAFFWRTAYGRNLVEKKPEGRPIKERAWTSLNAGNLRDDMLKQLRSLYVRFPDSMFSFVGHEESLQKQVSNFIKGQTPGGKVKYQAANGFHDDIILSEAHAYRAVAYGEGEDVYKLVIDGEETLPEKKEVPAAHSSGAPRLEDTDIAGLIGGNQHKGSDGYSLRNYGFN